MPRVTAAVLARDNETDIGECLDTLAWADERLVILDSRSRDRTAVIAQERGARVVSHRFEGFGSQREFGLAVADAEWLFYVDTDERATPALANEIRRVIQEDDFSGWWVPRRNLIWGREIRYGGWYPDYQLRLLKVGHAHYDPTRQVHEIVQLGGKEEHLHEPLVHRNYRTLREFILKQRGYVAYEADILLRRGVRPKPWTYVAQPWREFWRRYVTLRGYRDGWHGLALCALVAYYYGLAVTWQLGRRLRQARRPR